MNFHYALVDRPAWTATGQAAGAISCFKEKHKVAYTEAECLMDRNCWVEAEKLLQDLVTEGIFLRERYEANLSPSNRN